MATAHVPHRPAPRPAREHDIASLGAVVVSAVVLLGLAVGVAFLVGQAVDVLSWITEG